MIFQPINKMHFILTGNFVQWPNYELIHTWDEWGRFDLYSYHMWLNHQRQKGQVSDPSFKVEKGISFPSRSPHLHTLPLSGLKGPLCFYLFAYNADISACRVAFKSSMNFPRHLMIHSVIPQDEPSSSDFMGIWFRKYLFFLSLTVSWAFDSFCCSQAPFLWNSMVG